MKEIKAPDKLPLFLGENSIFLAGSIEMGRAEPWQDEVANELSNFNGWLLNPRRDDWDSSWEQSIDNPQFREQVEWELEGLRQSKLVAFYFQPETKSPITLLELGLVAGWKKSYAVVCCPDGFWRKGNVDIVCKQNEILVYKDFHNFVSHLKGWLYA